MSKRETIDSATKAPPAKHKEISADHILYDINCVCVNCNTIFRCLVHVKHLTPEIREILEKVRVDPTNSINLEEWTSVSSPEDAMDRLAILYLISKNHSCCSKIDPLRYPHLGWAPKKAAGRLLKFDMFKKKINSDGTAKILHLINTNKFAKVKKRSAILLLFFTVSKELLGVKAPTESKTKKKKRLSESISISD